MNILSKLREAFRGTSFTLTDEFRECLELIELTQQNLFITGKAGTGKSTLIEFVRHHSQKKIIVLAPTGLSAINVRGQTIHSFFKLPPRLITRQAIAQNVNERLYRDIDTIIIDEVSMVRADVLDGIDYFLRLHGRDKNLPFGGIQLVLVGDLYQLPPVLRREEAEVFYQLYETPYFFSAGAFNSRDFTVIELQQIFRQKDETFIEILNQIRTGNVSGQTLEKVNNRQTTRPVERHTYITLTTTNAVAESINDSELNKIGKPLFSYHTTVEGNFPKEETTWPVEEEIRLRVGARVMFVKNDKGRMWVNGTLGTVHALAEDQIMVKIDEPGRSELVAVTQAEWENIRYELDPQSGELKETVVGRLRQYPLRLAWAITIHKSQGQTFEKVNIDFSRSPFTHGQTYVALSRCRSLEGIILSKKIYPNDVIVDERILQFSQKI